MMRLALWLAVAATPAQALPGSVEWLIAQSREPRQASHAGEYALDGSGIVGLDPLTLFQSHPTPLPAATAQLYVIAADRGDWQINAAFVMVLDDAAPVCGTAIGAIGVDTGLASVANLHDMQRLQAYGDILAAIDRDLYDALEPQLPQDASATIVALPDGTRLPVVSSGYGDGVYGMTQLRDQTGTPVAIYVDFIGDRDDAWIEPPPCANV